MKKRIVLLFSIFAIIIALPGCESKQNIYDRAYNEGFNKALQEIGSYDEGYSAGYSDAEKEHLNDWNNGYDYGFQLGFQEGSQIGDDIPEDDDSYYVLNTSSKKFHLPHCSSVNDISPKNMEISYDDRQTLLDNGYDPCGRCNP